MKRNFGPTIVACLALVLSFVLLYYPVMVWLIDDWEPDGDYSHGSLVIPITLYFAWQKRDEAKRLKLEPSNWGFLALLASMGLLLAGTVAAETFLTRVSLVATVAASVWFVGGWAFVRLFQFPLAFLLLMIPIPDIIFNRITFPLQLVASSVGGAVLSLLGIPVLREGNLIVLPRLTLQVAEACSGIRSLVSLFTIAVLYAYTSESRTAVRVLLLVATVPIAIAVNGLRVAITGLAALQFGPAAAEGLPHTLSGWAMFLLAGTALVGVRSLANASWPLLRRESI